MNIYYLSLAFSIFLGALGQLFLKAGATSEISQRSFIYFDRFTLLGLIIYLISALAYTFALRKVPLSFAFPSVSISYFFVSLSAHLIFGESFSLLNIIALACISLGIFLLTL